VWITFTDITEIKRAREILTKSEAIHRLSIIVHDASDAITLQDMEGHILAWNPAAERLYGWSEVEVLAMNTSNLVPESRKEKELAVLKKLSNAEVLESYRTQRLTKDSRIIGVQIIATSLVNEANKIYAILTTERKIKSENMMMGSNK
jgi:two-component system, chemotaxis family, CheB/CheR fusion protein